MYAKNILPILWVLQGGQLNEAINCMELIHLIHCDICRNRLK